MSTAGPALEVEFLPPAAWEPVEAQGALLAFRAPAGEGPFRPNLVATIDPVAPELADLAGVLEALEADGRRTPGWRLVGERIVRVDDREAALREQVIRAPELDEPLVQLIAVAVVERPGASGDPDAQVALAAVPGVETRSDVLQLTITAPDADRDAMAVLFEAILETVVIDA